MIIDDALNMAYSYAATICQDSELCKVSQEFNGLAGETERTYITKSTTITSYSDIQNLLSKLNEKESVRKSKGVYYTPYDVVRFIVINSVKSAYGKLTPENIRREDIDAVPYKSFAAKKTVFDPTCGAGEYLLAALELKLDLLDKHYKRIPITVIHDTVTSIFGNDINTESIMITKLRIVLCILKRYGVDYIVGLAEKMRPNFLTYDYVVEEPGENKYDIIDYDKNAATTRRFYATVQNKMHYAVHGHTAAELIVERADHTKEHMGLTTWADAPDGKIKKSDVTVAKNYLSQDEMKQLNRMVTAYLDFAENMTLRHIPLTMQDWEKRLNSFIEMFDYGILQDAGKVSAEIAKLHAETEFEKYRVIQDRLFMSDFDKYMLELEENTKK